MEGKQLPKKLFVRWRKGDNVTAWLEASTNAKDLAEYNEKFEVGVYELKQTVKLVNKTTIDE